MGSLKRSAQKRRYNNSAYKRYEFSVRLDSKLYEKLEEIKGAPGSSLSLLIKKLLTDYFKLDETPR